MTVYGDEGRTSTHNHDLGHRRRRRTFAFVAPRYCCVIRGGEAITILSAASTAVFVLPVETPTPNLTFVVFGVRGTDVASGFKASGRS